MEERSLDVTKMLLGEHGRVGGELIADAVESIERVCNGAFMMLELQILLELSWATSVLPSRHRRCLLHRLDGPVDA